MKKNYCHFEKSERGKVEISTEEYTEGWVVKGVSQRIKEFGGDTSRTTCFKIRYVAHTHFALGFWPLLYLFCLW